MEDSIRTTSNYSLGKQQTSKLQCLVTKLLTAALQPKPEQWCVIPIIISCLPNLAPSSTPTDFD
jgi:hypothetical protein